MKDNYMKVSDIVNTVEKIAPKALQEVWDNSGLLIGFESKVVKNILTCLEINKSVLSEVKAKHCEMIITHHPLIFSGVKNICDCDNTGSIIMNLIENGISVYSSHTPFDKVKGGNNDFLAKCIGLSSVKNLNGDDVGNAEKMTERPTEADLGRIGKLKKGMSLRDMMLNVCDSLGLRQSQIRVSGCLDDEIKNVGVCCGSGAEFFKAAKKMGCDLFITGDVKYHQAQEAAADGLCIIDAGHYGTEKSFAVNMKEKLDKELDGSVKVIESETDLDPFIK